MSNLLFPNLDTTRLTARWWELAIAMRYGERHTTVEYDEDHRYVLVTYRFGGRTYVYKYEEETLSPQLADRLKMYREHQG